MPLVGRSSARPKDNAIDQHIPDHYGDSSHKLEMTRHATRIDQASNVSLHETTRIPGPAGIDAQ
jgi:hypothetical protein